MTEPDAALDWNEVRFFLAVARRRTFAKAARALGVDQTTVARRIASLERRLAVALFVRAPAGFSLTSAGERVARAAERMEEAALDLAALAADEDGPYTGTVRVATSESLAEHFVIPALRDLAARHPRVSVAILTGWLRVDLRQGEADLAVRLVRPTDPRLACRKLADLSLRLYASRAYVSERGMPAALVDHPLLGYEDAVRASGHAFTNLPTDGAHVALQANSGHVLLAAAVAGLGIAQLPCYLGDATPELVPVLPELHRPYSVWLVLPQAKRNVASVRAVSQAIAASFERLARAGRPRRAAKDQAPRRADRGTRRGA